MPINHKSGRLLLTAVLAASTTLTGPTFTLAAQPGVIRLAQAEDQGAATGAESGEAPVEPRRLKRQAQPEAGEATGANDGQTRQQQRRGAQSQSGADDSAEGGQSSRKQRSNAQDAGESSETGAASDTEQSTPRRQRRQAQEPSGSETETTAQPNGSSSESAGESGQVAPPSRRDRRQQTDGDAASGAASSAETGTETPRRDRRNRQQQSESAPTTSDEPAASGSANDEGSQRPATRRERNKPSSSEAPATAAQPETQPAENQNGSNRRQRQREQAGGAAAPTPDASAPATGTATAPTGEVPASPNAQNSGNAPSAPNAASGAGAPDATTAVPGTAEAPAAPAPATGETPAAGTASSNAATAGQPNPVAPGSGRPPAPAQALPGQVAPGQAQVPPAGTAGTPPAATGTAPAAAGLQPKPVPADVQNAPIQPGRLDQSDARVQTLQQPVAIQPITQERGERIREAPRYELPSDAKVVKRDGDRQILNLGAAAAAGAVAGAAAGYFIRSNDDDRLGVDSRDRYSERLPRGRTRETILRDNGVQVVTITNRYGDVAQRSRVLPDGREVVLFYDPDSADERRPDYYEDPGRDLPPIKVDIPEDEYVVDTDQPDEDLYYDTLVAPPVETVERIYSVDEVRRSPRIRDKVRRIDLATINFDFASATIPQDQVNKLQALADAIDKVVKDNPGETFLIEGHTDAVGGPEANLVLSDKRAESVASALAQYFSVPAENLVTQGYGEQELKVDTPSENRENRRVTVRRITALVKPVETSGR